ncbi:nudix hydrolase 13, mitochondrial-like [Humulus lupulus]|uniref:nudix hydrolase 13, mitochondrial-like n=1 Tax=Humulus lupulus TaxID=3486 RepID=UPI002B4131F6|nr:nudix hydrolase 13, mitochondrial-like [Humulus lupulus]
MSSMEFLARTGRHRQRYHNNLRLVSGCIPYRLTKDEEENYSIQVLMVSSPNRNDLVFPKGGWEDDETREEAACREALEEAGVIGILRETPLGEWEFRSKSRENNCSMEGGCKGYMFAMEVTEILEAWPERQNRDRRWLKINEAFELCRYEWMREALEAFLRVMAAELEEEKETDKKEDEIKAVSDARQVVEDCQMVSSSSSDCSVVKGSSSSTSHHVISHSIGICLASDMSLNPGGGSKDLFLYNCVKVDSQL